MQTTTVTRKTAAKKAATSKMAAKSASGKRTSTKAKRTAANEAAPKPARKAPARATAPALADSSREALIQAAIAEFSASGLAGARVDEIAAVAGVNKQLVYHYFGSKDGLYQAALEVVYGRIRAREQEFELGEMAPLAAMEQFVGFSFDYLADHPEFISLLNDENRHGASHLQRSGSVQSMHMPLVSMMEETLKKGIAQGVFSASLNAIDLYISIAALSYFFFSNNRTLSTVFNKKLDTPAARAARRRHVIEFVLKAVRP